MNLHLLGLAFRLPFSPWIFMVSDLFLLLGIDGEDRQAPAQERLSLALDVAKLSVAIRMSLPFFGLDIALQAVVRGM
jgi:hypothetical protein